MRVFVSIASLIPFLGIAFAPLVPHIAAAETVGSRFARCMVEEEKQPGFDRQASWSRCEEVAQAEREVEFAQSESDGTNMDLFKPALDFQVCTQQHTKKALETPTFAKFETPNAAELWAWNYILDSCEKTFMSDEHVNNLVKHYAGSIQQTAAFRDGVFYTGRAYVLRAVADKFAAKKARR